MITPRTTRLWRVPDLRAMQAAVAELACADPLAARACAVLVPTRSAAQELRRTIEMLSASKGLTHADPDTAQGGSVLHGLAIILPDLLTRAELYDRLAGPADRLTDLEREVIFRRAALDVIAGGLDAPVRPRAGLIVEILAFYDELRRRNRTIDAFERLMAGSLEPGADTDRGAERLLALTHFLTAAFREFDGRIAAAGRVDEHTLRARLLDEPAAPEVYRHVIVTIADQAADPQGLWPADYDLLSRLPGLERLDVLATEHLLATGYHERLHDVLPGIEEERYGAAAALPVLSVPAGDTGAQPVRWFVCRDREEELATLARQLKLSGNPVPLHRTALVFQRPLPYLYLARQVFTDARIPYEALDALPLAAEPFAAALDIVFSFLAAEGSRAALVELLRSPQWRFAVDGHRVSRRAIGAADDLLRDLKYFGGWERLAEIADSADDPPADMDHRRARVWKNAAPALRAARDAGTQLRGVQDGPSASGQVSALLAFIAAHEVLPRPDDDWYARHLRARGAILGALHDLRDACHAHDDARREFPELAGTLRRWIEGQTFKPRTGAPGLRLLDAQAAQYADVDELRLAGLVESDWPERGQRNIFYPSSLLVQLGWPPESDRLLAARARFHDLLALPRVRLLLSTFTLEDDAIVSPSALLDELETSGLLIEQAAEPPAARIFMHEALSEAPLVAAALDDEARQWAAVRAARTAADADMFHGAAGNRDAAAYAVSHVERYLECPFKYFAAHVLGLPEERTEESGLTPLERGQFVHEIFETFFRQWQASGRAAITAGNVSDALQAFERVAEEGLLRLGESDRALERTHLLGSAAAPGLAERAFAFEIEDGGEVIERLLEHSLEGEFAIAGEGGSRTVRLRAKADRIDLLADGTLRIIDYKLSRAPRPARALQLPIYGVCAEQVLAGRHGRNWTVGRAGYIAFREKNAFSPLGGAGLREAVDEGQKRLLETIDAIERGVFPPKPDEPFFCTRCGYSTVCRKDYIGDE